MKNILLVAISAILFGCNAPARVDPLAAERQRFEAEKAALDAEKLRVAEEEASRRVAAEKAADTERSALEAEKEKLERERAELEKARLALSAAPAGMPASAASPGAEGPATLLELEANRANDEKRRLELAKAEAEAARVAAERSAAEAKAREAALRQAEAEAALQRTVALFYEALAPHGDWHESDRHGFVWRPKRAIIDQAWRPYTDGRWQWTEYGWAWQSQEPYGWAVYHYGRWLRHAKAGWVWVPGHQWSPAWVSWRVKGSQHIGWAPLPPDRDANRRAYGTTVDRDLDIPLHAYTFLPTAAFDEPTYLHKFVEPFRQMEMIRGSRNITRIQARPASGGNSFVSAGPDPAMISSVIRESRENPDLHPVPRLDLVLAGKPPENHAADAVEGNAMLLHAPNLEATRPAAKPKEVRGKLRIADRDHGWSECTPEQETEWRAMVEREAQYAAALARAAAEKPRTMVARPIQVSQQVQSTPTPAPRVTVPPPVRVNPLNPSSLQPATGLFQRR